MPASHRRPWGVTIITLIVLTITCLSLMRLLLSITQWGFLGSLPGVSPLYLALSGMVWAVLGFALAWGLWRRKAWAPRWARWGALLFVLYYWLDRFFASDWRESRQPPANFIFILVISLLILAAVFWILSREKNIAFFGESNE